MSLVEVLVVALIASAILFIAYKVFFTQARLVEDSMEYLKVNEHFRKITAHLNNDIREANRIVMPRPIPHEDSFIRPTRIGPVVHLFKQVLDPQIKPTAEGQEMQTVEVIYELAEHPRQDKKAPRFILTRHEITRKGKAIVSRTRSTLSDALAAFVAWSSVKKPPVPRSINGPGDTMLGHLPSYQNGTGPDLVHVTITVERLRRSPVQQEVYDISLTTSICRRGKEVFPNP